MDPDEIGTLDIGTVPGPDASMSEEDLAALESPLDLEGIQEELERLQRGQDEIHKRFRELELKFQRLNSSPASGGNGRKALAVLESKVREIALRQQRMERELNIKT